LFAHSADRVSRAIKGEKGNEMYASDDIKLPGAVDGDVGFRMLDDYGPGLIWKRRSKGASICEICSASGKANKGCAAVGATLQVF
jgi:hypothetical protein